MADLPIQIWLHHLHALPPVGTRPLPIGSPTNPVTGAVNRHGRIPLDHEQLNYIQVPGGPYPMELLVNTRDECPGCVALQVDVLSRYPYAQHSYNIPAGIQTPVYSGLPFHAQVQG